MDKKDSERERLLRLIDSDAKAAHDMDPGGHAPKQAIALPKVLFPAGGRSLSLGLGTQGHMTFGMSLAAKVLWVLLALVIGYGAIDILAHFLMAKTPVPVIAVGPAPSVEQPPAPLDPVTRYQESFAKSDVFNPLRISETPAAMPVEQEGISGALKLVGIDWDDEPVAMIEDTQSGKTYFVKKDTSIKDIKVIGIQQDKVIISRGDVVTEIK